MQISVPAVNYLKAVKTQVKRNPTAGRKATMHGKILSHHSMREAKLANDAGFAPGDWSTLFSVKLEIVKQEQLALTLRVIEGSERSSDINSHIRHHQVSRAMHYPCVIANRSMTLAEGRVVFCCFAMLCVANLELTSLYS